MKRLLIILSLLCAIGSQLFGITNHPNDSVIARITESEPTYPFKFIIFGDNYSVNSTFRKIKNQMNELADSVLFAINVGDFAAGGSESEYWEYMDFIDQFQMPVVSVVGNHELNDSLAPERYIEYFGPERFYFDFGNNRFICVQNVYQAPYAVSLGENIYYKFTSDDLDWLETVLASAPGKKFVFMHTPAMLRYHYIAGGVLGGLGYSPAGIEASGSEAFTDLMKEYNVRLVAAGHMHNYDIYQPSNGLYGDVIYMITGGAGARLNPWIYDIPYGGSFKHFTVITLEADGALKVQVVPTEDSLASDSSRYYEDYTLSFPATVSIEETPTYQEEQDNVVVYPNPFSTFCNIQVTLNEYENSDTDYQLHMLNAKGEIIGEMLFDARDAAHQFEWYGTEAPAGLYFLRLTTEDEVTTQKILLVK